MMKADAVIKLVLHSKAMRIGILEDETLIADHLAAIVKDKNYDLVFLSESVAEAKEALKQGVDLVLLDIKVKGKQNGLDLAQHINEHYGTPFIFISSKFDAAVLEQAKTLKPFGFLTKPFKSIDVDIAIDLAIEKHNALKSEQNQTNDFLYIKDKGLWMKIQYADILYIEAADNYSTFFLKDKADLVITKSLKYFEEQLPSTLFCRINRSLIVRLAALTGMSSKVVMIGEKEFMLSETVDKAALKNLLNLK